MSAVRTPGAARAGDLFRVGSRAANPPLRSPALLTACALALAGLTGCALSPSGAKPEKARLAQAGKTFEPRFEERALPDLPDEPTWQDLLHRAFLANGDLELAYFDWKASVERIEMASAYPNSNVTLGYSYMFSSEKMKSFDRQTFSAGFDSSVNLSFPTKVMKKGEIALDEARATGERFRAAKFDLQRRVLGAWADYTLLAERLRIQREQLALTRMSQDAALARSLAGGAQRDLLRTDVSLQTSQDAIQTMEAELAASRSVLNGLLAREPGAPLQPPRALPPPRPIPASDDQLLAAAVDQNPELAALAHQVQGRTDALELARMQWIPDISPTAMFTGSVSQAVGAAVMLPTNIVEIRGGIREAEAMLRGSEAMLRQARRDRAASLVATLVTLRNSERQAHLFETGIIPLTQRLLTNTRQSYASGAATYADLLDAQRTLLDARLVVAQARAMREKQLAELEALMGTDIETLSNPTPQTPAVAADTTLPNDTPATSHQEPRHVH
ncbi:MAG: TolC family protein [Planctomycetes bacterium]|nr:TolC family protein [Planctomycetota bacterium]